MSMYWLFYNFSTNTAGVHDPKNEKVSSVLGESVSQIDTIAYLPPIKYPSTPQQSLSTYLWLPRVGGEVITGCNIVFQSKESEFGNDTWIDSADDVIELDKIARKTNEFYSSISRTLKEKIIDMPESDRFGSVPYRIRVRVPSGGSLQNFFFGFKRIG